MTVKKLTTLMLALAMLISVCIPLASCNAAEQTKPAQEIFYEKVTLPEYKDSLKTMGIDTSEGGIFASLSKEDMPKVKAALTAEVSKLSLGGKDLIADKITVTGSGIFDAQNTAMSGAFEYAYKNDSVKADFATTDDQVYLKIADLFEKYGAIDLTDLGGSLVPEVSQTPDISSITSLDIEALFNELCAIEKNVIAKEKLVETSIKDFDVCGTKKEVRSITFEAKGDDLKALWTSLVSAIKASKVIEDQLSIFGEETYASFISELDKEHTFAAEDFLKIVKYYIGDTYVGCDASFKAEGSSLESAVRILSENGTDKTTVSVKGAGSESSALDLSYDFTNTATGMTMNVKLACDGENMPSDMAIALTTATTEVDGAKKTDITIKADTAYNDSPVTIELPMTLTVRTSTADKLDADISLSLKAGDIASADAKVTLTVEKTEETPVTVSESDIYTNDEYTAIMSGEALQTYIATNLMDTITALMSLIPNGGFSD